jgi:hypothetical protein
VPHAFRIKLQSLPIASVITLLVVAIVLMMTQHIALFHSMLHTCLYSSDPSVHLSYRRCSLRCALIHTTHLTCLTHSSQVLIALFADVTALPISTDRATPSATPTKPSLKNMLIVSTVLGLLLAAQSIVLYVLYISSFRRFLALACGAVDRPVRIVHSSFRRFLFSCSQG